MKKRTSPPDPNSTLQLVRRPGETKERVAARQLIRPSVGAALIVRQFNTAAGDLSLSELVAELAAQAKLATDGNMARGEAMLIAQAHSLDAIFNQLARRAGRNMGEYLEAADRYMRLALKAQTQCRTTIEALANIKHPRPVAYVKQANIGQAVQVNNGCAAPENFENRPTELLEQQRGSKWLDGGTAGTAGQIDSAVEAVGAVNRAKDGGG
jgi:hypothetical protein